ncbi:MAG TPA: YHS domain-containing (seleno)protein [Puia sp.]|jgi:hypothetical protein
MKKGLLCVLLSISGLIVFSQTDAFREKQYNLEAGVGIKGYDPVTYFSPGRPQKGAKNISFPWHGITYYFSSDRNRETFRANPEKFEPQYGGWCAYAMGHDGSKVEVDPETFKIIKGKLFLFYNRFFTNTLKSWNQDEGNLHARADANWQKFIH